jgi:hypothetical protein
VRSVLAIAVLAASTISSVEAKVPPPPPFVATLSNHVPLAFGMRPAEAADALRTVLTYVSGRMNNEVYLAVRDLHGSLFFPRRDHLYLQFRRGRLTGWKGDWNLDETWR